MWRGFSVSRPHPAPCAPPSQHYSMEVCGIPRALCYSGSQITSNRPLPSLHISKIRTYMKWVNDKYSAGRASQKNTRLGEIPCILYSIMSKTTSIVAALRQQKPTWRTLICLTAHLRLFDFIVKTYTNNILYHLGFLHYSCIQLLQCQKNQEGYIPLFMYYISIDEIGVSLIILQTSI